MRVEKGLGNVVMQDLTPFRPTAGMNYQTYIRILNEANGSAGAYTIEVLKDIAYMTDKKIQLMEKMVSDFSNTFELRPGMLGSPDEVNSMFYLFDHINFILKYGDEMDYGKMSWMAFLIEKKYIIGAKNKLIEQLKQNKADFDLLRRLRKEYAEWQVKMIEGDQPA